MGMGEKRVKIVEIAGERIEEYFAGNMTVIEGLPDDITLVRTWEEPARNTFCFMFESEQFPVIEEGENVPKEEIVVSERRVNTYTHYVCPNCHDVLDNGDVVSE